jgi:hypothetical protein
VVLRVLRCSVRCSVGCSVVHAVHAGTRVLRCISDGPLNLCGLSRCQVIGYPVEIAAVFGLLKGGCFEEKNFGRYIQ